MKPAAKVYTALIMIFLFAPIVILLIFSFNSAKSLSVMQGFSLYWYGELFRDAETLSAVRNTLVLALTAAILSTLMGTAAAVGIFRLQSRVLRQVCESVTDIPMINPDIITGISLMLMFVFVGRLFGAATSLNFWTMLIAHVTFCLPYVILQVLPKLRQMDPSLPEAAMDLGCTPLGAFLRVEVPEIMPGIVTGAIMAFTLSLDDFVISYFTAGNGFQTLPIRIYNMTKKTVTPKMYALSTIIFFTILALLVITSLIDVAPGVERDQKKEKIKDTEKQAPVPTDERIRDESHRRKRLAIGIGAVLALGMIVVMIIGAPKKPVLNVYNWGEYISDGSEGMFDVLSGFEQWYLENYGHEVEVNYTTYASNEDMYAKLSSGAVSYDVIFPSDYMIERLRQEDLLLPLNYDNIPNAENISEEFRGLYFDPDDEFTIPYTYNFTGIIYDANRVDEEDTGDWDLMWNPKYAGEILQYSNPRDGFSTAQYMLDLDVNSEDPADWESALAALKEQAPLVKSYVMDEVYNMMESGEAAICAYYAGDKFTMADAQAPGVDLQFYAPERTNYFVDAMCIPRCCRNKDLAEAFINYMLEYEPALANAEYLYYGCPNRLIYEDETYAEDMGPETMALLYPEDRSFSTMYQKYAFRNLSPETLSTMNTLWEELKIN